MSCTQFACSNGATNQLLMPGQAASQQIHGPTSTSSGQACCESGRPVITDPITGQTMCSCQYDAQLLNYQRIAASGLPLNMYGAAAAAAAAYGSEQGFLPLGTAADQSAFYSPSANGFDLKDNLEAWRSLPYAASMYYPYDSAALAGYPFGNGYGVDLNGARRKNATRETTSTLKAWLHEHKKNPYPTKGEKIMLAIITKMTLTQVSTWFANARRRLKKENKMTWSPRNRCEEDDDGDGEDGTRSKEDDNDPKGLGDSCKTGDDIRRHEGKFDSEDVRRNLMDADDDSKSCDLAHDPCRRLALEKDLGSPLSDGSVGSDSESSLLSPTPPQNLVTDLQSVTPKPRIWSIVDTATSSSSTGTCSTLTSSIVTTTGGATRLSPLQRAARLDYLSPYPKPASWYAGSLGATTTVPGSFPLSAVYSPIVPSASALSAVTPASGAPPHSSPHSSESALSRLRTVAGTAFPTGDMSMPPKPATVSMPTVFNLSANRLSTSTSSPSSGSSAAIAAVAGVSIGHLTSMSNRVVS